jgi:hypothetical protein
MPVCDAMKYCCFYNRKDLRKSVPARRADADSTNFVRQGGATPLERFCVSPITGLILCQPNNKVLAEMHIPST